MIRRVSLKGVHYGYSGGNKTLCIDRTYTIKQPMNWKYLKMPSPEEIVLGDEIPTSLRDK